MGSMAKNADSEEGKLPATVTFVTILGAALVIVWVLMFRLMLQRW
jgi:hypothetical protein